MEDNIQYDLDMFGNNMLAEITKLKAEVVVLKQFFFMHLQIMHNIPADADKFNASYVSILQSIVGDIVLQDEVISAAIQKKINDELLGG